MSATLPEALAEIQRLLAANAKVSASADEWWSLYDEQLRENTELRAALEAKESHLADVEEAHGTALIDIAGLRDGIFSCIDALVRWNSGPNESLVVSSITRHLAGLLDPPIEQTGVERRRPPHACPTCGRVGLCGDCCCASPDHRRNLPTCGLCGHAIFERTEA